jgi:FKBP-type peptidyl-prolyl cis-trans isomerase SlyD
MEHIVNDLQKPTTVADDVVVSIEYSLTVDGEIVDSSEENEPLEYLQGYQNIIPGLERELAGLKIGDTKNVNVKPKDGYGELDPDALIEISRSEFPQDFELKPGIDLQLQNQDGELLNAVIVAVTGDQVKLDLNHPLAGKELFFKVKVVDLRDATAEELEHGHVHGEDFDEEDYDDDDLFDEDDDEDLEDEEESKDHR